VKIQSKGAEILDYAWESDREVDVTLAGGVRTCGGSVGGVDRAREALELRDGDKNAISERGDQSGRQHQRRAGENNSAWLSDADQRRDRSAMMTSTDAEQGTISERTLLGVSMALAKANAAAEGWCRCTSTGPSLRCGSRHGAAGR
jgi:enolase